MKAAAKYIRLVQGPTTLVAIFKDHGQDRNVAITHRELVPVAFRKGRTLK